MSKISGADLTVGMKIKTHGRIYKICEIEEPDNIGARLADVETTSGSFETFNLYTDSLYELRRAPARPRNRMVRLSLAPALAAQVDRNRLAGETTSAAVLRLVTQALDDWGG
jgi:hypothetical protein